MKIAVPTDDGLVIRHDFSPSRAFLVVTVESGNIIEKEIRWNYLSEMLTSEHGTFYNLCDCDAVVANQICNCTCGLLNKKEKKIIRTDETLITNILADIQTISVKDLIL
jgi:predicted Fe-Mo cluster-binding NifX family protein